MTSLTPDTIGMLHGALEKVKKDEEKTQVVISDKCKPMLRSLVSQYDAEDADARREAEAETTRKKKEAAAKDFDAGYTTLKAALVRGQIMHGLASKYMIQQHYWKIFIPVQIIVTVAALLAFFAAALDAQKNINVAFWLSLAAGALGFVAAFLNAVDRYLDWRTQGELHKKAAAVYGTANSDLDLNFLPSGGTGKKGDEVVLQGRLPLVDFQKRLENLNATIGELQIPYQIVQAFDYVERMIHEQVKIMNIYYWYNHANIAGGEKFPHWTSRTENDFLLAAYAVVATEITNHTSWPSRLPDPKTLAQGAHKKIMALFEVHFRDLPGMSERLQLIDYDQVFNNVPAAPRTAMDTPPEPPDSPSLASSRLPSPDPEAPADSTAPGTRGRERE